MSIKSVVKAQYQNIVDRALSSNTVLPVPKEGWIRTVRKALGLPVTQLAKNLGVTRAAVYNAERVELSGGVTLKNMQQIADAMDCRFVYAIVPHERFSSVQDMINFRARKKAVEIVKKTGFHMALEEQSLSMDKMEEEVERVMDEILKKLPPDFWSK